MFFSSAVRDQAVSCSIRVKKMDCEREHDLIDHVNFCRNRKLANSEAKARQLNYSEYEYNGSYYKSRLVRRTYANRIQLARVSASRACCKT